MGMAAAIYWPQGYTQDPTTPEKRIMKGRIRKGKLPQIWKVQQVLKPMQQSNARRESRKNPRNRKHNLSRRPITLRGNGYPTLTTKEEKMKQAVKLHRSVNKRNQRGQQRETKRHAARTRKIISSQWMEIEIGVLKTKSTISYTHSCRKRTNMMTS